MSYEHLFHSVTSQPCHLAVKQEVLYYRPTILFFFTLGAWTASIRYVGDKKKDAFLKFLVLHDGMSHISINLLTAQFEMAIKKKKKKRVMETHDFQKYL